MHYSRHHRLGAGLLATMIHVAGCKAPSAPPRGEIGKSSTEAPGDLRQENISVIARGLDVEIRNGAVVEPKDALREEGIGVSEGPTFAFQIPAGTLTKGAGEATRMPASIIFAVDVSTSMEPSIRAIASGIADFAATLAARGFDARFGFVTFDDQIVRELPLSGAEEAERFARSIALSSGQNEDGEEASLLAIHRSFANLLREDPRADSIKAVIAVTDAEGHTGEVPRNCRLQDLILALRDLRHSATLKFFYSAASSGEGEYQQACADFQSAESQLRALFGAILGSQSPRQRGGALRFPLTASQLSNEMADMLEKIRDKTEMACLTYRALGIVGDRPVFSWQAPDLKAVYRDTVAGRKLKIDSGERRESLTPGPIWALADRCCLDRSLAEAGVFSACSPASRIRIDIR